MSKFSRKFSRNSKKRKLKKGRENIYFEFDKILNKICEILEQILKIL